MRMMIALVLLALTVPLMTVALTADEAQAQIKLLSEQIAQLQKRLANQSASSANKDAAPESPSSRSLVCPVFSRTLLRGSSGTDVMELQKILVSGKFLTVAPTGYFGSLTEKALQAFQAKTGLVSGGSPRATGWGVFGPKTRAYLAKICAEQLSATQKPAMTCPQAPLSPATPCSGAWTPLHDSNQCHVGWRCTGALAPNASNLSPRIDLVDGPTTLVPNQYGIWSVIASDPENGSLAYRAVWGDEDVESLLTLFAGVSELNFFSSSRLIHSFRKAGTYTPEVTVKDAAGNTASATFSVTVLSSSSTVSFVPFPLFNTSTSTGASGNQCLFHNQLYPEGTETEGYTVRDLCLETGGICPARSSYIPKFICKAGNWENTEPPPPTNLRSYGDMVGSQCAPTGSTAHGASIQVMVSPGTLLCRDLLCATSQNYATITLTCQYETWVDWGIFRQGTTTASVCREPTPCEYQFGDVGRACAAKQNGQCPIPSSGHPLGF